MVVSLQRKREAPRGRYTPNLWSIWFVAPLTLIIVGAASFGLYQGVHHLLADAASNQRPRKPVDVNDVIKTTVTILTLVGAVLAGIYAYRKQILAEGDAHRADASQLADRYTTAAGQLGHEQAAVRLAGVYALARLADDWEEQRQVCIDVLCAYLRLPYIPDPTADGHKTGEREVRQTIIRVIRDHLRYPDDPTSWCWFDFDFTGAAFDGVDLFGSSFRARVSFVDAIFSGEAVSFDRVQFFHTSLVDFDRAQFNSRKVSFNRARFDGGVVSFNHAKFNGAMTSFFVVGFNDGMVTFDKAQFNGDVVEFDRAAFNGSTVTFHLSQFSGGTVRFNHAQFKEGSVLFNNVQVNSSSTVTFDHARFSGCTLDWGPLPVPAGAQ